MNSAVYQVMDTKIEIFSDITSYGNMTVAEFNNKYYQLGNSPVDIQTAINLWQKLNDKILTLEEVENIVIANGLKSQAI